MTDYSNTYYKLYEEMSTPPEPMYKEEKTITPPSSVPPVVSYRFEGPLIHVNPGYLYNSWDNIYIKWIEEQPNGALAIFKDKEMKEVIEKFTREEISLIESSHRNDLVFKVHLKKASPKTKKLIYHFKVLTTKDERNDWVRSLTLKVPYVANTPVIPDLVVPYFLFSLIRKRGFEYRAVLQQIFPGMLYNDWKQLCVEWDEASHALVLYDNERKQNVLDTIVLGYIENIKSSVKNDFGFTISMKGGFYCDLLCSDILGNKKYHLKTVTTKAERDKWVYGLQLKLEAFQAPKEAQKSSKFQPE